MILPHKYNRYVEGLDSKDAKVSLFKGKCSLNHLKLKPTVLHDFGLPARVRYVSLRLKERCRIFLLHFAGTVGMCACDDAFACVHVRVRVMLRCPDSSILHKRDPKWRVHGRPLTGDSTLTKNV